jgi:hypothetical protein
MIRNNREKLSDIHFRKGIAIESECLLHSIKHAFFLSLTAAQQEEQNLEADFRHGTV